MPGLDPNTLRRKLAEGLKRSKAKREAAREARDATTDNEMLNDLVQNHPMPTWRAIAWPIMGFMALFMIWANFAELDEVAVAEGEVTPQGKVKVIQHLEGGIIEDIFVNEGDGVTNGTPLVQLDLASSGVNKNELQVRLDSLLITKARLEAETQDGTPVFPANLIETRPAQVAAERQNLDARKRQLEAKMQVLREQVRQRELDVQVIKAKERNVLKSLRLARERLKLSRSLLAEGLTAKIEHLELEAEVENLAGEMEGLESSLPRAEAAVKEARERLKEEDVRFKREAQEELNKTGQSIARVNELLAEATKQGIRALIRSPIAGVVKNMRYNTLGGVVKPGEPILEIVPTGGNLVIETRLNPTDRGYVQVGQKTTVKISTYDFSRYGGLDGSVIQVAPDSSTDENGIPYFRVIVQTDKYYLGDVPGLLPITPGMQATVDIHTGAKSVMEYLITPVLKLRHEAFRER